LGVILHANVTTAELIDRWPEGQWTQPTICTGQHNETTRHTTWYPPLLSMCQTSTPTTSARGKSIIEYIQNVNDVLSLHPYNNIHIYCRLYMQVPIHTACTSDYSIE
jgi:hypothetical protein